jgi:tRNA (cmo5U34)-methyltransferase
MSHAPPSSTPHVHHIVPGFGADRAALYDAQAALALPGASAIHEVAATALASQLDGQDAASLLFVGLGTGTELLAFQRLDVPGWRFTGVDPSDAMLEVARKRLEAEGLSARTSVHVGELQTLPTGPLFDGGQMIGVLHHVEGDERRLALLREMARRLKPGAPFVVGCRVGNDPVMNALELRRMKTQGLSSEQLELRRQGLAKLRPPESDSSLFAMLERAGFISPRPLFLSMQFKVFLARLGPGAQG